MKIGAVFPRNRFEDDPAAIRDYAQAAEGLGYDYLLVYDLVIDTTSMPVRGCHEPFTLLSYLAGATEKLELATGIVVLPSRQTVLVAKQAAEVDLLSGGRLRLGVAAGWNRNEYRAMGADFDTRGERLDEQIAVLRNLWTNESVTFEGKYHTLDDVGLNPLPMQRPIPIWLGGHADAVLKRVARAGDGWLTHTLPPEKARESIGRLHRYLEEAGRELDEVSIGVCVDVSEPPDYREKFIQGWCELGVTHLDFETLFTDFTTLDEHVDALRRFKNETG